MAELNRIMAVVDQVAFPGYRFDVGFLGPGPDRKTVHYFLDVAYNEPDVMTGVVEEQRGRKWAFPEGQTEGQIVQTCFKAIMTSLEHRAREHFLFRGRPVLQPHLDLRKLWEAAPEVKPAGELPIFEEK